jgi:RNA polymerase sigma-70 factor, ECF subfamily
MPLESNTISTTLLQRVRTKDQFAWSQLVALFGPLVYHWARKASLPESDAADIVQDVFLAVHKGVHGFDRAREGGTFRGWLRQITRHKVCDIIQRRTKQIPAEGGTDAQIRFANFVDPMGEDTDAAEELAGLAQRALGLIRNEFTEKTWLAYHATAIAGKPVNVVAVELGMSLGAIYVARTRVNQRLKEELEGLM